MVQTTQGRIGGPPSGGCDAPGLAFPGIKSAGGNVKDVSTVPGSYLTPSGGTGDGLSGRRTVPTASGARRDDHPETFRCRSDPPQLSEEVETRSLKLTMYKCRESSVDY